MRLLLPGGEQGEHGEVGGEEEEGTQLDGLGKAKAMLLVVPGEETPPPRLAQQEEGGGTVDGEWGRGGGAAVGYISKRLCFRRVVCGGHGFGRRYEDPKKGDRGFRRDASGCLPVGGRAFED